MPVAIKKVRVGAFRQYYWSRKEQGVSGVGVGIGFGFGVFGSYFTNGRGYPLKDRFRPVLFRDGTNGPGFVRTGVRLR